MYFSIIQALLSIVKKVYQRKKSLLKFECGIFIILCNKEISLVQLYIWCLKIFPNVPCFYEGCWNFFASLFTLRDHINFRCSISTLCIIEVISRCPFAINTRFFSSFSLKREYLKLSSPWRKRWTLRFMTKESWRSRRS